MNEPETTTLQHYVGVLWRRRLAILLPIVVLAVAGYVSAHHQRAVYEASSEVLLNQQDQVATSLVGVQTPIPDPGRFAVTQTNVAWTAPVARRVLAAVGDRTQTPKNLLDHTSIYPDADVLFFRVSGNDPLRTVRLAGAWARVFTRYRRELDTRELSRTLAQLDARLAALRGKGGADARIAAALAAKAEDVQLLEALRRSNVYVVQTPSAADADQVAPRPLRTTAIAVAVGALLGLVLALLLEGLDSRVRTPSELEEALALPFLVGFPLRDPGAARDAALTLWARLGLRERNASSLLLIAGGAASDGVADVAFELARAAARAGRRVVLVDADFRTAPLDRLLDLHGDEGSAAVAAGDAEIESAARLVSNGGVELRVVGVGRKPADPGALATSPTLAAALQTLRADADEIIVIVPPIAAVGDALVLAPAADATLLVLSSGGTPRRDLRALARSIGDWPTRLPGFVVVDVRGRGPIARRRRTPEPTRTPDPRVESLR